MFNTHPEIWLFEASVPSKRLLNIDICIGHQQKLHDSPTSCENCRLQGRVKGSLYSPIS